MSSKLKEAREKAGYSLDEISEILKIRKQYLIGLEEDIPEDLPSQVYIDGYKKIYYEFLGLKLAKKQKNPITLIIPPTKKKKINEKYVVLISSLILVIIVSCYLFLKFFYKETAVDNDTNVSIGFSDFLPNYSTLKIE